MAAKKGKKPNKKHIQKEVIAVPMGRPTKYDPGYHPMEAVNLMAEGKHLASVAAHFNISKSTLFEWIERHPDFSDSIKRGKMKLEAFIYEKFLNMAQMPSGMCNVTAMIFLAKNAVGWSDKVEHQINPDKITDVIFE